jgi:pimeloyl-ACP methyl ester carboxylesterase
VLLNGVFSDGSTWRFVTGPLAAHHDLLVIDLPGTGESACVDPDARPDDAFTPRWIGHRVWAAVTRFQSAQPAPRQMVLVGHSLAGAVILRMFGDPLLRAESVSERASSVGAVLIGSADIGTKDWSPVLIGLAKLTEPEITIGGAIGVLDSEVRGGIIRSVEHPERAALEGEATRMVAVLEDRDRCRASQLMLRRIRPIDTHELPVWSAIRPMVEDHHRVDLPVMLLWGRDDDILPLATGEKLASEIPGSRLVVIDDARHSVHQEDPLAVAVAIERFADEVSAPGASSPGRAPSPTLSREDRR